MVEEARDLPFRTTLVILCILGLVEVGFIINADHGISWSKHGAMLVIAGLFCAWLVVAAVRRFRTSRLEDLVLAVTQILCACEVFAIGLRSFLDAHRLHASIQMFASMLVAFTGCRRILGTMKTGRFVSAGRDDA